MSARGRRLRACRGSQSAMAHAVRRPHSEFKAAIRNRKVNKSKKEEKRREEKRREKRREEKRREKKKKKRRREEKKREERREKKEVRSEK